MLRVTLRRRLGHGPTRPRCITSSSGRATGSSPSWTHEKTSDTAIISVNGAPGAVFASSGTFFLRKTAHAKRFERLLTQSRRQSTAASAERDKIEEFIRPKKTEGSGPVPGGASAPDPPSAKQESDRPPSSVGTMGTEPSFPKMKSLIRKMPTSRNHNWDGGIQDPADPTKWTTRWSVPDPSESNRVIKKRFYGEHKKADFTYEAALRLINLLTSNTDVTNKFVSGRQAAGKANRAERHESFLAASAEAAAARGRPAQSSNLDSAAALAATAPVEKPLIKPQGAFLPGDIGNAHIATQNAAIVAAAPSVETVVMNKDAIPGMLQWLGRAGYSPDDLIRAKLRCVHIAGTKGKGTVAALTTAILTHKQHRATAGKVGTYMSPHVVTIRERIMLDGQPISQELFTKYFNELWGRLQSSLQQEDAERLMAGTMRIGGLARVGSGVDNEVGALVKRMPFFFRFMTLLAIHVFMREGVKSAVVECGIGGEYDATNILPAQCVTAAVVTQIDKDHENMLGNTLDKILWHKTGIFKQGVTPVVLVDNLREGAHVVRDYDMTPLLEARARRSGAARPIRITPEIENQRANPLLSAATLGDGPVQRLNYGLAATAAMAHLQKLSSKALNKNGESHLFLASRPVTFPVAVSEAMSSVSLPGRFQVLSVRPDLTLYLDGSHTGKSLEATGRWFAEESRRTIKQIAAKEAAAKYAPLEQALSAARAEARTAKAAAENAAEEAIAAETAASEAVAAYASITAVAAEAANGRAVALEAAAAELAAVVTAAEEKLRAFQAANPVEHDRVKTNTAVIFNQQNPDRDPKRMLPRLFKGLGVPTPSQPEPDASPVYQKPAFVALTRNEPDNEDGVERHLYAEHRAAEMTSSYGLQNGVFDNAKAALAAVEEALGGPDVQKHVLVTGSFKLVSAFLQKGPETL